MTNWTWMKDVDGPPKTDHGDDIEVMWHGGTTARGNLHGVIPWIMVMAYKLHGKVPTTTLDTRYGLVWEARPGINQIDNSYVAAFG